jgi:hypothetical protein
MIWGFKGVPMVTGLVFAQYSLPAFHTVAAVLGSAPVWNSVQLGLSQSWAVLLEGKALHDAIALP